MSGSGDQCGGQAVAFGVGVVGEHVAGQRGVFVGGVAVVDGNRSIVDGGHGNRHQCCIAGGRSIRNLVAEAVDTAVVGGGSVGEAAVGIEDQCAVSRSGEQSSGKGVAVDVDIVGQHVAQQTAVLAGRIGIVVGDSGVVDGVDGDGDGGGGAGGGAVGGGVGEGVGAVVVGVRGVGEGAVGVEDQFAVGGSVDQGRGQRITLDVNIVGEDARHQSVVLIDGVSVVVGDGGVVDGGDGDVDRGGGAGFGSVGGGVGEGVGAVVVGVGGVGKGAVGVEDQFAVGGAVDQGCGQ